MAKLVLHIGAPKTGTTYIQTWLKLNIAGLQEQGWSYPEFITAANHRSLALLFQGEITPVYRSVGLGDEASLAAEKQRWIEGLAANVKPASRWIISSEFLSGRLLAQEQVGALVDLLGQFFDEIHVVVFARRQEYLLPSTYSQNLKAGGQPSWGWEFCQAQAPKLDFSAMYDRWHDTDGITSVQVAPFLEANKADSRRVLEQFGVMTGIEFRSDWQEAPAQKSNQSLSAEGLALLRVINPYVPRVRPTGDSNRDLRIRAMRRIMELTPGPTFNPADDVVRRIHEYFVESNVALVAKLPPDPQWHQWLNQPIQGDKPQQLIPQLSAARTAELMIALSEPGGPIAWGLTDKRPTPPPGLRTVVRERFAQRLRRAEGL